MTLRHFSNTSSAVKINQGGGIGTGDLSFVVDSVATLPVAPFTAGIERGVSGQEEIVLVTAINGGTSTLTVTRGYDGTTAKTHPNGAAVQHSVAAIDYTEANAHVNDPSLHAVSGMLTMFAGAAAPTGWLICDGAAVSRATYAALFAVIATTYGVGDGSTTFNLPNLKGRVPVGFDGGQTEFDVLGETGGAKTHALSIAELASHDHTTDTINAGHTHAMGFEYASDAATGGTGIRLTDIQNLTGGAGANATANPTATGAGHTHGVGSTGSGTAHNNLQPYFVVNYIIKT